MLKLTPQKGVIAVCSRGMLGLITKDKPQTVNYGDGKTGTAWVGIHLTGDIGSPWSSRTPRVVGNIGPEGIELFLSQPQNTSIHGDCDLRIDSDPNASDRTRDSMFTFKNPTKKVVGAALQLAARQKEAA